MTKTLAGNLPQTRQRCVFSLLASTTLVLMGVDTGNVGWGSHLFWLIAYSVPAFLILLFAVRPTLHFFELATASIMAVGCMNGLAFVAHGHRLYYISHNLILCLFAYLAHTHAKGRLRVPL